MEIIVIAAFLGFASFLYAGASRASVGSGVPVDPEQFSKQVLIPALYELERCTGIQPSKEAARFILTIMLQESGLKHRYQLRSMFGLAGPARGFPQFERIGVKGVMQHQHTVAHMKRWAKHCWVTFHHEAIWRALEGHDVFATGVARLNFWASPHPIPNTAEEGWKAYIKVWRPGKPHSSTWYNHWKTASQAVEIAWSSYHG